MQFGFHLLDRGVITSDQLVSALREQQRTLPPLGQLAIEENLLSSRDVFHVLRVQTDLGHDRFGDTAVALNLLSKRDVARLLMIQSDRRRPLAEVLVAVGVIDQSACDRELESFRAAREEQGRSRAVRTGRIEAPEDFESASLLV